MDISFYVLLVLACLVLLLAMWACAGSSTPKWGPDLTLELPPHLLQEVLFGHSEAKKPDTSNNTIPSAPSELACDPLLSNEYPVGRSAPPPPIIGRKPVLMNMEQKISRKPAPMNREPQNSRKPVPMNMENAVRVLPARYVPNHRLKPMFSTFTTEQPS